MITNQNQLKFTPLRNVPSFNFIQHEHRDYDELDSINVAFERPDSRHKEGMICLQQNHNEVVIETEHFDAFVKMIFECLNDIKKDKSFQ